MEIKKINDRELLAAFTAEMERRGYTIDQAIETIGVGRSTFFNWQKKGIVSKRGRRAMATFIPTKKESEPPQAGAADEVTQYLLETIASLSLVERCRLLAFADDLRHGMRSPSPEKQEAAKRLAGGFTQLLNNESAPLISCPTCKSALPEKYTQGDKFNCPRCGQKIKIR